MRLWYARRGIPWVPFLACLLLAGVAAVAAHQWSHLSGALLPGTLAACAAADGFLFDEPAEPAVRVTPRGGLWARFTRTAVAVVPAMLWCAVLATLPDRGELDLSRWIIVGLGAQAGALGLAGLSSHRGMAMPGSGVAPAVAGMTLAPFVIGPMIGWTPL